MIQGFIKDKLLVIKNTKYIDSINIYRKVAIKINVTLLFLFAIINSGYSVCENPKLIIGSGEKVKKVWPLSYIITPRRDCDITKRWRKAPDFRHGDISH